MTDICDELELIGRLGGTMFVHDRHTVLPDSDWLTSVKSAAKIEGLGRAADRLFMYHHEREDTFVLAFWLIGPDDGRNFRLMQELIAMDGPPGHEKYKGRRFDVTPMTDVLASLRPADEALDLCRTTCEGHDDELRRKSERDAAARSASDDWLKRKTGTGLPVNAPFAAVDKDDPFSEALLPKKIYG